jgi:Bacterial type II secretion system protein N.
MERLRGALRGGGWVATAFFLTLVLRAPAAWLPFPQEGALSFSRPTGHPLAGAVDLAYRGQPLGTLRWHLARPTALALPLGLNLEGPGLALSGTAQLTPSRWTVILPRLALDSRTLKQWLGPYEIAPEGEVQGRDVRLTGAGPTLTTLGGTLRWTGGPVRYRLGGTTFEPTFPPLSAELGQNPQGAPAGTVSSPAGPVLDFALGPGGWVDLSIKKRLLTLARFPAPDGLGEDAQVLALSEKVF